MAATPSTCGQFARAFRPAERLTDRDDRRRMVLLCLAWGLALAIAFSLYQLAIRFVPSSDDGLRVTPAAAIHAAGVSRAGVAP